MRKLYISGLFRQLLFPMLAALVLTAHSLSAQVPTVQDCLGAIPVCQDNYIQETTYLGSGSYPNEIFNPTGDCQLDCPGSCLDGEQNSVWYVFTVQTSGNLRLTIDPFYEADDYDWAVYDITFLRCDQIYNNYQQMQKSCNAWGATGANGNTGISTTMGGISNCNHCGDASSTRKWNIDLPVLAGSTYVLVIENWGTSPEGGYTLDFSESTASIYDDVRPFMSAVQDDDLTCGSTTLVIDFSENVECISVNPGDFILSGPGGPYTVTTVSGFACELGADMESQYTITFVPPIREDGAYSVQLSPFCFVYDACSNFATGNTISFNVDLGGPLLNEFNISITPATCGLANGSITGLGIIGGTGELDYLWINETGDTVGYTLDLTDVPMGNYILHITDQNTCAVTGGPYFVDQVGAPSVVDDAMVIQPATWMAPNGSITGIQASGTEPLSFSWKDESNVEVGTGIDLMDVYSGNYTLTVTDANDCDTVAGPYFISETGGPVGVTAVANPDEICIGEAVQLNAQSTGGTGIYTYLWSSNIGGFSSELQNPVFYPTSTTIFTVVINDGYNEASGNVTVTVNPLPLADAGIDITIPYGTSTTLSGNAGGGSGNYSYTWEPDPMLIIPDVQNPSTINLFATTFFMLTVTDLTSGCISLKDTVVVMLSGGPLGVSLIAQDDSICEGASTTIQAYGFGGDFPNYEYTWYEYGGIIKYEMGESSSLFIQPGVGDHTYEVDIFDGFNHFITEITISVLASPEFQIVGGPQIVACPYDSVSLAPSQFIPGATYYWSNGATTPTQKVGTTGIGYDSRTYNLTITTDQGCNATSEVEVIFDFSVCFGIDENEPLPLLRVYPNPASGWITLEFEDGENYNGLYLIDPVGQLLMIRDLTFLKKGLNLLKLDLSGLPPGIYLLEAVNQRFIHHHKIIVE